MSNAALVDGGGVRAIRAVHQGLLILGLLLLAPACDHQDPESPIDAREAELAEEHDDALAAAPTHPVPSADPDAIKKEHHRRSKAAAVVMPEAQAAFGELQTLLDAKHVGGPLSSDELWTAAMQGVLARLDELPGHEINALLSPRDHNELVVGTKGRLVGVGVMIERVANVLVIRDVIVGGPAAAAGLRAGDRILGIDGERVESLDLPAVVNRIRGEDGSEVRLFVQRDTEEWDETLTRGLIEIESVEGRMLDGGVGLVRITSFAEKTATQLDEVLAELSGQGLTSIVLDLRDCPGGLLEAAIEVSHRFIPAGKTLLTVRSRDEETSHVSEGEYPWQQVPMAVLIGPHTASGAEIVADAIGEHDRGLLVGEATFGKHTIESIHELSDGWAVKFSVSRFATASGQDQTGTGVQPNIVVPTPADGPKRAGPLSSSNPAIDPPLATALGLLRAD